MLCLTEEFSRFYIEVLNQFLTIDLETFNEVHPEEWELIKPDKKQPLSLMCPKSEGSCSAKEVNWAKQGAGRKMISDKASGR